MATSAIDASAGGTSGTAGTPVAVAVPRADEELRACRASEWGWLPGWHAACADVARFPHSLLCGHWIALHATACTPE